MGLAGHWWLAFGVVLMATILWRPDQIAASNEPLDGRGRNRNIRRRGGDALLHAISESPAQFALLFGEGCEQREFKT